LTAIGSLDISSASGFFSTGNVTSNSSSESSDVFKTFSDVFDNLDNEEVSAVRPEQIEPANVQKPEEMQEVKDPEKSTEMAEEYAMDEESENVIEDEIDKKEEKSITEMLDDYVHLVNEALMNVAESLGVSPEQLVDAIEKIGLNTEDLLSPEGMKQLFAELNNLQDPLEIILNEDLHGKFKEVMAIIGELNEAVGENQELTEALKNADFTEIMEKVTESIEAENIVNEDVIGNEDVSENISENTADDMVSEKENPQDINVVKESSGENQTGTESGSDEGYESYSDRAKNTESDYTGNINNSVNSVNNGFNNVVNNISEAINNQYGQVTAENIVNQIQEQIKLTTGNNFSSIELTLTPETLGKVNIQVIAKDGAVTAQISAETEMAKNAIESHISELKETLTNQNIKVDAVEVTIASHEFEQNFENSSEQGQNLHETKVRRRVSLEDYFADEESEETEQMIMQAEGSTVNFMA